MINPTGFSIVVQNSELLVGGDIQLISNPKVFLVQTRSTLRLSDISAKNLEISSFLNAVDSKIYFDKGRLEGIRPYASTNDTVVTIFKFPTLVFAEFNNV